VVWRDKNGKWNGNHRYSTSQAAPPPANPQRWKFISGSPNPDSRGYYNVTFKRSVAAASSKGDIAFTNSRQDWIYAFYEGAGAVSATSMPVHADRGRFVYNAMAPDSVLHAGGTGGYSTGLFAPGARAKGLVLHVVCMSLAWTVFSYAGYGIAG
jgi:hypothetical protein